MIEILPEIKTFLLAMTPLGELRLAIPVGLVAYKLEPITVYLVSVLGNLVPVFLILFLLRPVSDFFSKRISFSERFFCHLFSKTQNNHSWKMKKYGLLALFAFVAIPLPVTGGWTSSLIAVVFGIPFRKSFPLISLGVATAGLIVLTITLTGITIEKYLSWQILLGLLFAVFVGFLIYKSKKNNNHNNNNI